MSLLAQGEAWVLTIDGEIEPGTVDLSSSRNRRNGCGRGKRDRARTHGARGLLGSAVEARRLHIDAHHPTAAFVAATPVYFFEAGMREAPEKTTIARVGEGIVSAIGSATSRKEVLENPDKISKLVLEKGLEAGTALELFSIDLADVDAGKNIAVRLQNDQAEADLRAADAKAEERRAMVAAREQGMSALVQERRAVVVDAEAEITRTMAEAFREGRLGIMD